MGALAILDHTGHDEIIWDIGNAAQIMAARKRFDELRAKGFAAYKVGDGGEPGEILHAFDPWAGKIIMAPAMVGG